MISVALFSSCASTPSTIAVWNRSLGTLRRCIHTGVERKNGWQLAEAMGDPLMQRVQDLGPLLDGVGFSTDLLGDHPLLLSDGGEG